MNIDIKETTVIERQKMADGLGISLGELQSFCLEQLLLRIYSKLENPWPDDFFDSIADKEEIHAED